MDKKTELNKLEKTICVLTGAITGLLPGRLQMKLGELTNNTYEAAVYMSISSRTVNAVWATYGLVSGISHFFGVDLDPSPGNIATWASIPIAVDSLVRETFNALRYGIKGGAFTNYNIPWGEPIFSLLDSEKYPDFYKEKMRP